MLARSRAGCGVLLGLFRRTLGWHGHLLDLVLVDGLPSGRVRADERQVARLAHAVRKELGRVDKLIGNLGLLGRSLLGDGLEGFGRALVHGPKTLELMTTPGTARPALKW